MVTFSRLVHQSNRRRSTHEGCREISFFHVKDSTLVAFLSCRVDLAVQSSARAMHCQLLVVQRSVAQLLCRIRSLPCRLRFLSCTVRFSSAKIRLGFGYSSFRVRLQLATCRIGSGYCRARFGYCSVGFVSCRIWFGCCCAIFDSCRQGSVPATHSSVLVVQSSLKSYDTRFVFALSRTLDRRPSGVHRLLLPRADVCVDRQAVVSSIAYLFLCYFGTESKRNHFRYFIGARDHDIRVEISLTDWKPHQTFILWNFIKWTGHRGQSKTFEQFD